MLVSVRAQFKTKKETTKPKQNKRKHQETDADCQLTYDSPKVIITPSVQQ